MLLNVTEYERPETIAEALRLLARPGVKTAPLAGGTLLVGQGDHTLQALVDLHALGLHTISEQGNQILLGAMLTLQALVDAPFAREMVGGILAQAAKSSAARLIRNAATLGGTLAAGPAANADLSVALAVLNAQARLVGQAERLVPAEVIFAELQPGELVTEVLIERPSSNTEGAFLRVARTPVDVALVHAAATLLIQGNVCQQARVAIGGVGMMPVRLSATESFLVGKSAEQEQIAAAVAAGIAAFAPTPDFRASPAYRRDVAAILARRVLEQCADAARWKQLMGTGQG
ncbi:MAG TPA: FAD binding domain-containing protein [Ktedonobacterales bacterium]|nr:FAD binding domain-containing protein [Ktedonobacterales bacterium]